MSSEIENDVYVPYEEIYKGHEIYIEKNPDPYREDLDWSVCRDNEVLDEGGAYTVKDALAEAYRTVDSLVSAK